MSNKAQTMLSLYFIGFVLTVILTVGSYGLVRNHVLGNEALYVVLAVVMILQLLVQVVFFFRLNTSTESETWNLVIFLFTILIMLIVISGSLWIMYNLNYHMVE